MENERFAECLLLSVLRDCPSEKVFVSNGAYDRVIPDQRVVTLMCIHLCILEKHFHITPRVYDKPYSAALLLSVLRS